MDESAEKLLKLAKTAMTKAYCPYSKFRVGCALRCEDGTEFTGNYYSFKKPLRGRQ